jgi:hypothetical protein
VICSLQDHLRTGTRNLDHLVFVGAENTCGGGAVLVLTGEREATEMAGDEREQEAVVAICVLRLRARR